MMRSSLANGKAKSAAHKTKTARNLQSIAVLGTPGSAHVTKEFVRQARAIRFQVEEFANKGQQMVKEYGTSDPIVTTITSHHSLVYTDGSPAVVDPVLLRDAMDHPAVVALNKRLFQADESLAPTISASRLNKGYIFKGPGYSFKVFATMTTHITGARSAKDAVRLAQYVRTVVELITGKPVQLNSMVLDLVNTSMKLFGQTQPSEKEQPRVNRSKLVRLLHRPATQVAFDRNKHQAVKFTLALSNTTSTSFPIVFVFQSGEMLVMGKSFEALHLAYGFIVPLIHVEHRAQLVKTARRTQPQPQPQPQTQTQQQQQQQ
jgi:hypothetical protein